MTPRKLSLIALLVLVPVALNAQRRGGRGGGGGPIGGAATPTADDCRAASGGGRGLGAGGGASDAARMINCTKDSQSLSKDLQKANPVEILLDAKKDLQLSKDEEKELKTINDGVKNAIKPFLKTIDSVDREFKKTGDFAPTSGQMVVGRGLRRESADSVMAKYQTAVQDALGKLSDDHRQPATDLLKKEQEELSKKMGRPPV
jgi:hypothetical protein